jgi:hypothetical protein
VSQFKVRFLLIFLTVMVTNAIIGAAWNLAHQATWIETPAAIFLGLIDLPAIIVVGIVFIVAPSAWPWSHLTPYVIACAASLFWATCISWPVRGVPRHRTGHCRQCDYDLTGDVTGRCPECGEPCGLQLRYAAAEADMHPQRHPGSPPANAVQTELCDNG